MRTQEVQPTVGAQLMLIDERKMNRARNQRGFKGSANPGIKNANACRSLLHDSPNKNIASGNRFQWQPIQREVSYPFPLYYLWGKNIKREFRAIKRHLEVLTAHN